MSINSTEIRSYKMPSGIPYIVGNEAAERFSYYGMKGILAVYMTDYLLMSENKATVWVHAFGIAAYFLPVFGGLLSDIFWGKYRTILTLSIAYCFGHLVLSAFESQQGLAAGLMLIAIGSGGIKSCVSAHVGDQFNKTTSHLIERVFGYFYLAINVGAFISGFLTPVLLEHYGPWLAFGVPAVLMLIATIMFWMGRNQFIAIPPVGWKIYRKEVFNSKSLSIILKLSVVYVFIAVFWSLYDQTMSTWVLQAKRELMIKTIDLYFFKFEILPSQVQVINPLLILILTPIFSFYVYPFAGKFFKVTPMRKISAGLFITAVSFLVIGWVDTKMEQGIYMPVYWQFLAYFIITCAEVLVSITALEFSYTQAPNVMKSLIMGLFWLSVSMGNVITTLVNEFIVTDVMVTDISTGAKTYFTVHSLSEVEEGLKLEFEKMEDLKYLKEENGNTDTLVLSGTFLVGDVNPQARAFEILDIDQKPVTTLNAQLDHPETISINQLKGSTYFYFFTLTMLLAAILFIGVAMNYKEERFIQEHVPSDIQ